MSSVQQAMETLTKQWYNAITKGFSLSPNNFQLYQGNLSLGNTSEWMWDIFDTVPPESINNAYNPAQGNSFAQQYGNVVNHLVVSSGAQAFQTCMGDYYMDWMDYVKKNGNFSIATDPSAAMKTFQNWAATNAPDKISCATNLVQAVNDPVNQAVMMFALANGKYAYNETIGDLKAKITDTHSKSVQLNSQTASSDTSHTWAGGGVSVVYDLFSFGGSGSYDKETSKAWSAGLDISLSVDDQITFTAGPLKTPHDSDPILSKYQPWYNSAALGNAYQTKDNTVWKPGTPSWDSTFGPNGDLQFMCASLVVVDGVSFTLKSNAAYSSSEQTKIQAAAKLGLWPFFTATGQGGFQNKVTFDDSGNMTVTQSSPKGNPIVIGVLVSKMSDVLG
jgi:hypothetical protein